MEIELIVIGIQGQKKVEDFFQRLASAGASWRSILLITRSA